MKLRPYQEHAVNTIYTSNTVSTLVVSPGGSGKTVMIAELVHRHLAQGDRVLVLSHRKELVHQAIEHFGRFGIEEKDIWKLVPGHARKPNVHLVCGSIQKYAREKPKYAADVVIVDEAHHAVAGEYEKMLARHSTAKVYGFTATPYRLDGTSLGLAFDEIVEAAKVTELVKLGYLANPIVYTVKERFLPNLRKLRIYAGDYSPKDLEGRMRRPDIAGNMVDNHLRLARGRRTITFAATIEHALALAATYNAHGIRAEVVSAKTPLHLRAQYLEEFRSGEVEVLVNCMVLSEGYDLPACEVVTMMRPTLSQSLFIQQAARMMRPSPSGERPLLLDHAGNVRVFGLPQTDREFTLRGKMALPTRTEKVCPICDQVATAGTRACEGCGYEFPLISHPAIREPVENDALQLEQVTTNRAQEIQRALRECAAEHGVSEDVAERAAAVWEYIHG